MADCVYGENRPDDPGQTDSSGGDRRQAVNAAEAAKNMGAYVTPHVLITGPNDYHYLSCGIDSLDISCAVVWTEFYEKLSPLLSDGKLRAQDDDKPVILGEYMSGPLSIYPTGRKPNYLYHLEHANAHLFIANAENGDKFQNVFVSFKSKALWMIGVRGLLDELKTLLNDLGGSVEEGSVKVSRCDLCSDWHIPGGISLPFLEQHSITRSRKSTHFMNGKALETLYIGSPSGPVQVRIYDKSREILKSRKDWFKEIWGEELEKDVWRVEFQVRRPALKQFGIRSVDDLLVWLASMWLYLTNKWFSLKLLDDLNTSRRTFHPWWKAIQEIASKFGHVQDIERIVRPGGQANSEFYLRRAAGCFLTYAAILGFADMEDGIDHFSDSIRRYWNDPERDFTEARIEKTIELGKVFDRIGGFDGVPF
jgi:hypothetical protein